MSMQVDHLSNKQINRNLIWRKDRGGGYACRWMFKGQVKQQTLLDKNGNPITKIEDARIARDRILAPYAIKQQDDVLAVLKSRAERTRSKAVELVEEVNPPLKIADAWRKYNASPRRPDSGDSTHEHYHSQFKRFCRWISRESPGTVFMRDVTDDVAEKYAIDLKDAKFTPNNYNKHITTLRLVWRTLGREIQGNGRNPWQEIKHLKGSKKENSRRTITPEQFTAILKKANDADLHDLIFTLGWTGQRLVDIVMLEWPSISFKRQVIELLPRKTARKSGARVVIPLLPQLADLLTARKKNAENELVFPELAATYNRDSSLITKRIQDVFEKAKLTPREKRAKYKRSVAIYGAHSLRHYFVTEAMAAGWPTDLIRKITGHTSEAMAQHYQHVDAGLIARLAGQLGEAKRPVCILPKGQNADKYLELREKVLKLADKLTKENAHRTRMALIDLVGNAKGSA